MKEKTTLHIIECGGSEYEIGRQYGEQARDSLQSAVGLMYRSMQLMPYQAGQEAVSRAANRYLENVRSFDPEALDRVITEAHPAPASARFLAGPIQTNRSRRHSHLQQVSTKPPGSVAACAANAAAVGYTIGLPLLIGSKEERSGELACDLSDCVCNSSCRRHFIRRGFMAESREHDPALNPDSSPLKR